MLDFAVVGGGPTGSRVACKLSEKGYSVTVFEKRETVGLKPCCTGIISQECASLFGVPDQVIFKRVNSAVFFSPSGNSIRVYRPEAQACIVDRSAFDKELARQAQSCGAIYCLNTRVRDISIRPDKVVLEVETPSGRESLAARAAVLADGFDSAMAKRVGLKPLPDFVGGVQTEVNLNELDEVEVYLNQKLAPGFFAWLVPTCEGKGFAGLLSRGASAFLLKRWICDFEARRKISPRNHILRYGGIPLKPLPRTYGDRFLVVGDAAGQAKPTTGGGIYFGLLCADLAADTLHNAHVLNNFSARSLACYERNWYRKLKTELQWQYFARRVYERLSDKQIDRIFIRCQSEGIIDRFLGQSGASFDYHGSVLFKTLKSAPLYQIKKYLRNAKIIN